MPKKVNTIVINNFGGRLTRIINGDLNSGFAKFDTSFGYDPFSKPMNLTWLNQPSSIAGMTGVVVAGINSTASPSDFAQVVYVVDTSANLYQVLVNNPLSGPNPNVDSVVSMQSVHGNYTYGASMQFFGQRGALYIGASGAILTAGSVFGNGNIILNGASSVISTAAQLQGDFHPLAKFSGKLLFGNGATIGAIDATGTIISSVFTVSDLWGPQYSQLNPPLPADQTVRDLDASIDGNYLQMSASSTYPDRIYSTNGTPDSQYSAPGYGAVYGWNGVDQAVTTAITVPAGTTTALQNYLQSHLLFLNDAFGAAVSDGVTKILSLPNNKSPLPNATGVNGNFLTWMAPEMTDNNTSRVATLYYYGSLDQENPVGLYRLLRWENPTANSYVYQVPYQAIVSNSYSTVFTNAPAEVNGVGSVAVGKHYFSAFSVRDQNLAPSVAGNHHFMRFIVSSNGPESPQEGVYETQTQLFSKRVSLTQIRVYTEPTVANNGFDLDVIGVDGEVVTNGDFSYTYTAGTDITQLQGSLQRINFDPSISPGYGFGIRITNTGTTNMTIKKIEIDYTESGK
jgi:hypothetical protein